MPKGLKGFQKGHKRFISKERYKEIGKKISISLTGKKLSREHRAKIAKAHLGMKMPPFTEEHKRKIGIANSGPKPWRRGKNSPTWKGGIASNNGYVMISSPNHPYKESHGYVREHRLVVEKQIGRFLKPNEVVHHLGNKDDNRPKMLIAFINDKAHQRFHRKKVILEKEIIFDGRKLVRKVELHK